MCVTEPLLAVSCFGTKHLCSSRAWHLKTYLYNVSAPFVFFILILSSVFVVSHPDCQEESCCWFHPALFQTEALAAFGLSPLLRAEANKTKSNTVLPASSSLRWDQHHQTAVGWNWPRACRWMWYYCHFSLDALPVRCTWLQSLLLEGTLWGPDFQAASFNMSLCKIPAFSLHAHNWTQVSNQPFSSDSAMLTDATKPNVKLKKNP